MSADQPKEEKRCKIGVFLCVPDTRPTRIILWLVAIAIVSFVIGFGILAASGAFSPVTGHANSPFSKTAWILSNTTEFPLDGATAGNVSMNMGAGEITLNGGSADNDMMEVTVFSKAPEWQPEYSSSLVGSVRTVRITDKGHTGKALFAVDSPNRWEIRLADRIPVAAEVRISAGDCRLVLGTLNLTSLDVHAGAGDTVIDFSGYNGGRFDASIMHGIGDLTLRIPASGNFRITVVQGVGDIAGTGFILSNGAYTQVGFNPALPVNEIFIKQGVGDLRLEMV